MFKRLSSVSILFQAGLLSALSQAHAQPAPQLDDLMTPDEIAAELGLEPAGDEQEPEVRSERNVIGNPAATEALNQIDKDRAEVVIIVNKAAIGTTAQTLVLYQNGVERGRFYISTGREQRETAASGRVYVTSTPTGYFRPTKLTERHYSQTWQAFMNHSVFFNGGVAIHATVPDYYEKLGTRASGGCVRMRAEEAKMIFDLIRSTGAGMVPQILRDGTTVKNRDGSAKLMQNYKTLIVIRNIQD